MVLDTANSSEGAILHDGPHLHLVQLHEASSRCLTFMAYGVAVGEGAVISISRCHGEALPEVVEVDVPQDASTRYGGKVHPLTTILRLRPYRQLENSFSNRPITQSCSSLARNLLYHAQSKVPAISKTTTSERKLESRALYNVLAKRRSRSDAECPFLNLYWCGEMRQCSSRSAAQKLATCSEVLLATDSSKIG